MVNFHAMKKALEKAKFANKERFDFTEIKAQFYEPFRDTNFYKNVNGPFNIQIGLIRIRAR